MKPSMPGPVESCLHACTNMSRTATGRDVFARVIVGIPPPIAPKALLFTWGHPAPGLVADPGAPQLLLLLDILGLNPLQLCPGKVNVSCLGSPKLLKCALPEPGAPRGGRPAFESAPDDSGRSESSSNALLPS